MLLYRVETRITLLRDDIKVTLAEQSFQSQTAFFAPFEGAFNCRLNCVYSKSSRFIPYIFTLSIHTSEPL